MNKILLLSLFLALLNLTHVERVLEDDDNEDMKEDDGQ